MIHEGIGRMARLGECPGGGMVKMRRAQWLTGTRPPAFQQYDAAIQMGRGVPETSYPTVPLRAEGSTLIGWVVQLRG